MKLLKENIYIARTEQWEYTATIKVNKKVYKATGNSETTAELHLLRLLVFGNTEKVPVKKIPEY